MSASNRCFSLSVTAEYWINDLFSLFCLCSIVNASKEREGKVCAVGTTVMRTIESAVTAQNQLKAAEGWTNKFIFPPYDFHVANSMITNFHLPKSSVLIMVCAFGGHELVMEAYEQAIKEDYRFYSYGDAMLIV